MVKRDVPAPTQARVLATTILDCPGKNEQVAKLRELSVEQQKEVLEGIKSQSHDAWHALSMWLYKDDPERQPKAYNEELLSHLQEKEKENHKPVKLHGRDQDHYDVVGMVGDPKAVRVFNLWKRGLQAPEMEPAVDFNFKLDEDEEHNQTFNIEPDEQGMPKGGTPVNPSFLIETRKQTTDKKSWLTTNSVEVPLPQGHQLIEPVSSLSRHAACN